MARYVPKTYNNRRGLRIILGVLTTLILSAVIAVLILFFYLEGYVVNGQLEHPLLGDEFIPSAVSDDEYDDEYGYGEYYENGYEYEEENGYDENDEYPDEEFDIIVDEEVEE